MSEEQTMKSGWRYYNHALLPDCAPNEEPDTSLVNTKDFWKSNKGIAIMARWTSEYDCKEQTKWWYVVKDDEYDISLLKAKRRYEINKGRKIFDVRAIDATKYVSEIIHIQKKAYEEYPVHYRPIVDEEKVKKEVKSFGEEYAIFGAFEKETDKLCGYSMLINHEKYVNFAMLKVLPECERMGINAAMVDGILGHYKQKLSKEFYICDGERSLFHETSFQDYLEKYFGFRKVFCKLHVKYRFPFSLLISAFQILPTNLQESRLFTKIRILAQFKEISENCVGSH